jgi:hypothetical protein
MNWLENQKKKLQSSSFLVLKVWNQLNQTELNWFNKIKPYYKKQTCIYKLLFSPHIHKL